MNDLVMSPWWQALGGILILTVIVLTLVGMFEIRIEKSPKR